MPSTWAQIRKRRIGLKCLIPRSLCSSTLISPRDTCNRTMKWSFLPSEWDTDKRNQLMNLLCCRSAHGANGKRALTLVFVETKRGADNLEYWLSRNGFSAIAIHGDKVEMERERALRSFKSGVTPILVATDVASQGLDTPHVGPCYQL